KGANSLQGATEHHHTAPAPCQYRKRPPRGDGWSEDDGGGSPRQDPQRKICFLHRAFELRVPKIFGLQRDSAPGTFVRLVRRGDRELGLIDPSLADVIEVPAGIFGL